jgi:serine/threonine-protein kinase
VTVSGTQVPLPSAIGKYRIQRVLGRGAMGVVYLGLDPTIDRPVAVKTIVLPDGLEEEKVKEFRARFLREARAAGKLSHPAIVTVYEADDGSLSGVPFIAMEFVEGLPWNYKVRQGIKQDPDAILPLVRELASALDYAHKNGVVHRDIKPANIVQTPDGRVKLMDFGIAKVPTSELTREGQFLGTPAYMSPEQVMGRPVDGRSDLFSLGTVLYELFCARKPFPGDDISTVTFRIAREDPPPPLELNPSLPAEVDQILRHLLEKDPEKRYLSASELVEDIDAYLAGAALPHAGTASVASPAAERTLLVPQTTPASPQGTPRGAPPATPPPGSAPRPSPPAAPPSPATRSRLPLLAALALVAVVVLGAAVAGGVALLSRARGGTPPGPSVQPGTAAPESPSPAPPTAETKPSPGTAAPPPAAPPPSPATGSPSALSRPPRKAPAVKPPPSSSPENGERARQTEKTPPPAPVPPPATVTFTFSSKILKGGFQILVDGKEVFRKKIQRKFTLKDETYTGTFPVPPGEHEVLFEVQTEIQNVSERHAEKRTFSSGEAVSLHIKMTRLNKEVRFAWSP